MIEIIPEVMHSNKENIRLIISQSKVLKVSFAVRFYACSTLQSDIGDVFNVHKFAIC